MFVKEVIDLNMLFNLYWTQKLRRTKRNTGLKIYYKFLKEGEEKTPYT